MTNREIAANIFRAHDAEMLSFTMKEFPFLGHDASNARVAEIDKRHGFRHGWIEVNGEHFDKEKAFPNERFNRFPADQGLSD